MAALSYFEDHRLYFDHTLDFISKVKVNPATRLVSISIEADVVLGRCLSRERSAGNSK
jgi:hypothetical protein